MTPKNRKKWYVVRKSSIHKRGVFARRDIPKDTRVVEYVGERIDKDESKRRADRLMAKSRKTGGAAVYIFDISSRVDLDGDVPWNDARLINHSCEPNCEAIEARGRIWIHALRDIEKGEELTYNYGFDFEHWHEHPCRCGAHLCVGFILDRKYWPRLRRLLAARVKLNGHAPKLGANGNAHFDPMHARHVNGVAAKNEKGEARGVKRVQAR